ncbi:STAS domain-containing protein [Jeotgalibacillus haloalkalitolerans]|uniref:STAS domain-containing protein n=1 Tax=Jeotgalibacillus haloalkalitolerans TaxID=3104292 RepID=A0ABU5KH90_9BACL|nr:STAS domain-containing protein [Jeotgalibacillus sp. HH7-29]MDZ5710616.1 STAS domain-containing protein [Jeotgalibacillus sp. HH7-29]
MGSIQDFASYLKQNGEELGEKLLVYSLGKVDVEIPQAMIEESRRNNGRFFKFFSDTLHVEEEISVEEKFLKWSRENIEEQVSMMDKLSSLIRPYPDTRMYFSDLIGTICLQMELSTKDTLFVLNRLNFILDINMRESILLFERYKNRINEESRKEILELSAPIVPIQPGVVVLPLVGKIDSARAEHLMTKTIPAISDMDLDCVIIDFSGIVTIDNEVAGHVFDITNVLKLLGIDVNVSGLRPELAQHIVLNGISFKDIQTFSNVEQAIKNWDVEIL